MRLFIDKFSLSLQFVKRMVKPLLRFITSWIYPWFNVSKLRLPVLANKKSHPVLIRHIVKTLHLQDIKKFFFQLLKLSHQLWFTIYHNLIRKLSF